MRASDKETAPQERQLPEARPTETKGDTVDTTSLAQPAHPVPAEVSELEHASTIAPRALRLSARLQRGIALAEERFEEITKIAPWTWEVPSCSGDHRYVVDLKHALCTCPDHPPAGERCKHGSAAAYKKAKTATCSGCRERFRHRDLVEAGGDNLTFFEGDLLCRSCGIAHGVL